MAKPALIFLHAPSVYDFRKTTNLRGPVSDLVPSSSVFEMYPIGFTTLAVHLEDNGYPVRIVNIAALMLQDSQFDVEAFIANLPTPLLFGIDLHWLPHAHGAIEIAKIVKRFHCDVPILLGGFSSTYFHRELMDYPEVDFILRGDSTEGPLLKLIEALSHGDSLRDVPNLTWREASGEIQENEFSYSPSNLDIVKLDYRRLMTFAARDRTLASYLPFLNWLQYPIMPVMSCRGCTMNCLGCGGSTYAFRKLHGRQRPAYRAPEQMAADLRLIADVSNGPVFVLGDIRQAGPEYAQRFLDAVRGVEVPVIVELFHPASRKFLAALADALPGFALEISMESHDVAVRRAYGKGYRTEEIEETMRAALELGCQRLDIFFMTGLAKQTFQSVMETADYAETLLRRFGEDRRLHPFIGPMAPFVDPGSRAFEEPDRHGYRIFHRTFEEHRQALTEPSWQFTLNYETQWMTRREIVMSTYEAGLRFNQLKIKYGLIKEARSNPIQQALRDGMRLAAEIERLRETGNGVAGIQALRPEIEAVNSIRVLEEHQELSLPLASLRRFKMVRLAWFLFYAWLKDKQRRLQSFYLRGRSRRTIGKA